LGFQGKDLEVLKKHYTILTGMRNIDYERDAINPSS